MGEPHKWRGCMAGRVEDRVLLILTFLLTLVVDLTVAIGVGVALGLALRLARRGVRDAPHDPRDRQVPLGCRKRAAGP